VSCEVLTKAWLTTPPHLNASQMAPAQGVLPWAGRLVLLDHAVHAKQHGAQRGHQADQRHGQRDHFCTPFVDCC